MLYRFENFLLDSDRFELRREQALIAVEPQVFHLLVFLISNRDRVMSKDALLDAVWGGRIVSESTIASRINAARQAIGDSGSEQRLIRTTIGRGVRFVGAITEQTSDDPPQSPSPDAITAEPVIAPPADTTTAARADWPRRYPLFVAGLAVLCLLAWWPLSHLLLPAETAGKTTAGDMADSATLPRMSIVVLPFANLSNDLDQDYLADWITDDLTGDLSRIVNSFVIARTTAFSYKAKPIDVKQIGRQLGVRYVLEGSVWRQNDDVQIDVQLIDSRSGANIMGDRVVTDRSNLVKAQSEITARLARTLQLELLEDASRRIEQEKLVNVDARDLIMRGWALYYRPQSAANLRLAQHEFEHALALAPESVDARVGIATVLGEFLATGMSTTREQDIAQSDQLLGEAIELDRNHARARAELGRLRRLQGRLMESQIELEKALALDRNNAHGIIQSGITLIFLGQPAAALPHLEKFLRLNPRWQNLFFIYYWLGHCHLLMGQTDEALTYIRKGYSENPNFAGAPFGLAAALGLAGDTENARKALEELWKLRPEATSLEQLANTITNWNASPAYVALREKTIDVGLRHAGLPDVSKRE